MKFPKLKHPNLCRVFMYLVTAGPVFLALFGMLPVLDAVTLPDPLEILLFVGVVALSAVPLFRNLVVLLYLEMELGEARCHMMARTRYPLPGSCCPAGIRKALRKSGEACAPRTSACPPVELTYRFCRPISSTNCGTEKVVALWETELLEENALREFARSARSCSAALRGKKTARHLDRLQKKAPLNRVTVALILANHVPDPLWNGLYDRLEGLCGDPEKACLLVCVVDWSRNCCVFPSKMVSFHGSAVGVKNKGIRLIRRLVFGGKTLPLQDRYRLPPLEDYPPEQSLWQHWKQTRRAYVGPDSRTVAIFRSMDSGQFREKGTTLYIRQGGKGLCLWISRDKSSRTVTVEPPDFWSWPAFSRVSGKAQKQFRQAIAQHYARQGWKALFRDPEPEELLEESHGNS